MTHTLRTMLAPLCLVASVALASGCGGDKEGAAAADSAAPVATAESPMTKGEATYGQICASCHQATGLGVDGTFPPLKGSSWLNGDPKVPISIIIAGLQGEITVDGKTFNGTMQAWGMLSDEDVANVLTFTRAQWGNTGTPVTAEEVEEVREAMGSRGAWTADELKTAYPGAIK